jgi:hypothetical protein
MDIDRAFREWCAVLGFSPNGPCTPNYRLGRASDGRVQIEQLRDDGSSEVVATPMAETAFCEAVQLVTASFRIKTILVARTVARRVGQKPKHRGAG